MHVANICCFSFVINHEFLYNWIGRRFNLYHNLFIFELTAKMKLFKNGCPNHFEILKSGRAKCAISQLEAHRPCTMTWEHCSLIGPIPRCPLSEVMQTGCTYGQKMGSEGLHMVVESQSSFRAVFKTAAMYAISHEVN